MIRVRMFRERFRGSVRCNQETISRVQGLHVADQFDEAVLGAVDVAAEGHNGFGEGFEGVGRRLIHGCAPVNWLSVQYK